MLTGGIALISYLRLSTTTNDLQLSYILSIARTKLSTCNLNGRIRSKGQCCMVQLHRGNLFLKTIIFKKMEMIPVKDQDHTLPIEARSEIIAHADWLNDHQSADKQYEYVKLQNFRDSEDPELLWRYGRACHCFYTYSDTAIETAKAAAIWDGLSAVEKAVHIDSQNANAFMILGRLTGCGAELYMCGYKSIIRSCKMAMQCRDHLKLATELDPTNHNAWFSLGIWSYNVSVRPFYEKIVLFQLVGFKPDINESIAMMEKSNKLLPHPLTSLSIGKCYLYINKKDEAKKWLEEAANFKSSQAVSEGTAHAYSKRAALQLLRKV